MLLAIWAPCGFRRGAFSILELNMSKSNKRQRRLPEAEMVAVHRRLRLDWPLSPGATKIIIRSPSELPPIVWLGRRRYWMRRHLEAWIAKRLALAPVISAEPFDRQSGPPLR